MCEYPPEHRTCYIVVVRDWRGEVVWSYYSDDARVRGLFYEVLAKMLAGRHSDWTATCYRGPNAEEVAERAREHLRRGIRLTLLLPGLLELALDR